MKKRFKPKKANEEYSRLPEYSTHRESEISPMLEPYIAVTDAYGRLLSRICLILGDVEPVSVQDSVIRDLMSDVFDFLYESRLFILRGNVLIAYPLARRAYESLSLLDACILDESVAKKWASGKQFGNAEIRKLLGSHEIGESEKELQLLYKFFCEVTHPNREMIAYRGLGEGNKYVFGPIAMPNLVEVTDYCQKHLNMWFWLCPMVVFFYKEKIFTVDPTFHDIYKSTAERAQNVNCWLGEQLNHLLEKAKTEENVVQPKFI